MRQMKFKCVFCIYELSTNKLQGNVHCVKHCTCDGAKPLKFYKVFISDKQKKNS